MAHEVDALPAISPAGPAGRHDLSGLALVVLESDDDLGRALVDRLVAAGWQADVASGLHEVAAICSRRQPDAVVLGPTFMANADALATARRTLPGIALVDLRSSQGVDGEARRILDNLTAPVLSFHLGGPGQRPRLAWCNRAIETWLGRRAHELLGNPTMVWGHVHGDDVQALEQWFAAPTSEHEVIRVRWVSSEGRVAAADVHAVARGGHPGAPAVADLVLQDASQEVALASAVATHRSQIRALVQRSDEVVFQLRLRPLTVAWVNDAAPKLLGIEPTALRDDASRLFDAMPAQDADRVREALQAAVGGETTVRFEVRRATGTATIELVLRPLRGSTAAVLAVGREIRPAGEAQDAPASTVTPAAPTTPDAVADPAVVEVARVRTLAAARSFAEAAAQARQERGATTPAHGEAAAASPPPPATPVSRAPHDTSGRASDDLTRMIEVV